VVTIRSRGKLPHWEDKAATYFVTFRLRDSLPKAAVEKIEFERRNVVATAKAMQREISEHERERLADLFSGKIESYLDAGSGACHLANPEVARMVAQTLFHFDAVRYRLFAWCVMPNHVHVVFQPLAGNRLAEILHTWKSYSAKRANRILRRAGDFWQREYYDHLIRDESDLHRVVRYVLENPRKAGLKDWPWVGMQRGE
jgi:REP element-mobilizing transposase RayT